MEDVGLDPSNARHRLRFRQMVTCGKKECQKKAMGAKPKRDETSRGKRAKLLTRRTEEDDRLEVNQYVLETVRNFNVDLLEGMQVVDPRMLAYRQMMGR